jgi:hypothetical protein
MDDVKVNIEKSPIPLVWIDTSILIKMAKLKSGERISEEEKQQIKYLYDSIIDKTKKKKMICPMADQYEEIEIGERLEKECRDVQLELSLGIKFIHRRGIEDFLISRFMKAYIDRDKEVNLTYKELFHRDPIKELDRALSQPFIIDVHIPLSKEILKKRKKAKKEILLELEYLRQEKLKAGVTFKKEREMEFEAYFSSLLELKKKFITNLFKGEWNIWDFLGAKSLLHYEKLWEIYKGQPSGLEGLSLFFHSDYFKQIPTINVACNLRARLATSPNPIKSGDSLDIDQISTVLPFFNLIITDKAMKNHIRFLELQKIYNTEVLSIRDFNEIKNFLESL